MSLRLILEANSPETTRSTSKEPILVARAPGSFSFNLSTHTDCASVGFETWMFRSKLAGLLKLYFLNLLYLFVIDFFCFTY
jgi:hypothetical protein